eukprot:403372741
MYQSQAKQNQSTKFIYRKKSDVTAYEAQSSGLIGADIKQNQQNYMNDANKQPQTKQQNFQKRSQSNHSLVSQPRYKRKESLQEQSYKCEEQEKLAANSIPEILPGMIYDRETQRYQIDKVFLQVQTRQKAPYIAQGRDSHNQQRNQGQNQRNQSQNQRNKDRSSQVRTQSSYKVKNTRPEEFKEVMQANNHQQTQIHKAEKLQLEQGLIIQTKQYQAKQGKQIQNQLYQSNKPQHFIQNPETYYVYQIDEKVAEITTDFIENDFKNKDDQTQLQDYHESQNIDQNLSQFQENCQEQVLSSALIENDNLAIEKLSYVKVEYQDQDNFMSSTANQSQECKDLQLDQINTPSTMTESPNSERYAIPSQEVPSRNLNIVSEILSNKFKATVSKAKLVIKKENIKFAKIQNALKLKGISADPSLKLQSQNTLPINMNTRENDNIQSKEIKPQENGQSFINVGKSSLTSISIKSEEPTQQKLKKKQGSTKQLLEDVWTGVQNMYYEKPKCLIAPKVSEIPNPF